VRSKFSICLLQIIEEPLQHIWRSAGKQAMLTHESKSLQKGITTLLEASHDHLLVPPSFHHVSQKTQENVRNFLVRET
jgi:hypothetical protein